MVRGRKQRGQDFGSCPPPPTPRRHQGWRPASAWESTSFRFLSGLRRSSIFRCTSISSTYPSQSVILSDFHSNSLSEPSQSVDMTLLWPTWRWTWWPTSTPISALTSTWKSNLELVNWAQIFRPEA